MATGLPWTGGRSYWRDTEVLHFQMPSEPAQRFAPGDVLPLIANVQAQCTTEAGTEG